MGHPHAPTLTPVSACEANQPACRRRDDVPTTSDTARRKRAPAIPTEHDVPAGAHALFSLPLPSPPTDRKPTMIIDETFCQTRQGCYELTQVHHVDGMTVRVRVHRDAYAFQSHAVVEVLTPDRAWTALAHTPHPEWYPATPLSSRTAAPLRPVAAQLLTRARRILTLSAKTPPVPLPTIRRNTSRRRPQPARVAGPGCGLPPRARSRPLPVRTTPA